MALTRKLLKSMGIEDDKIEQIIEAHTESTDALKEQRDESLQKAENYDSVVKERDKLKGEAEAAKAKGGDGDGWKEKFEKEHADFETFKTNLAEKEVTNNKRAAYAGILKELGITELRAAKIASLADIAKIELDGDKIKDADKLKESAKTEWAEFIPTTTQAGQNFKNPPQTGGNAVTKEQFKAMGVKDRSKLQSENPDLYNQLKA